MSSRIAQDEYQTNVAAIRAANRIAESNSTFVRDALSILLQDAQDQSPYTVNQYHWIISANDKNLAMYAAGLLGLPSPVSI